MIPVVKENVILAKEKIYTLPLAVDKKIKVLSK